MFEKRIAAFIAGRRAERLALRRLRKSGLVIVERNARVGRDEIDIVAVEGDVVVFVEVKQRRDSIGQAHLALDAGKLARLRRAVRGYLAREGLREVRHRIDLVAVAREEGRWRIDHVRDAEA